MVELSTLSAFILYLIRAGYCTTYNMERVGLSIGATSPALKRLTQHGLIAAGKLGPRGRKEYRLTPLGKSVLAEYLRRDATAPVDYESLARLVAMKWSSKDQAGALKLLNEWLKAKAGHQPAEAGPVPPLGGDPTATYRWMLHQVGRFRAEAEAKAVQSTSRQFRSRPATSRKSR